MAVKFDIIFVKDTSIQESTIQFPAGLVSLPHQPQPHILLTTKDTQGHANLILLIYLTRIPVIFIYAIIPQHECSVLTVSQFVNILFCLQYESYLQNYIPINALKANNLTNWETRLHR